MTTHEGSGTSALQGLAIEPGRDTGIWYVASDGELHPASGPKEGARAFFRYDGSRLCIALRWEAFGILASPSSAPPRLAYRVERAGLERLGDDDVTEVRHSPPPMAQAETSADGSGGLRESSPDDSGPGSFEDKTRVYPPRRAPRIVPRKAEPALPSVVVAPPAPPPPVAPPSAPAAPKAESAPLVWIEEPAPSRVTPAKIATPPSVTEAVSDFGDDETRVGPPPARSAKTLPPMKRAAESGVARHDPTVKIRAVRSAPVLSPVRVAILAMMVAVVAVVTVGTAHKRTAQVAPAAKTAAASTASHAPSSAASPAVPPHAAVAPASPAPAPVAASSRPAAGGVEPAAASAPHAPADERAAVLAVESGALDRAAGLYDALAAAHADRPAYREAARILHTKAANP